LLFVKAKLQCGVYKIGIIKKQMLSKTKANAFRNKSKCFINKKQMLSEIKANAFRNKSKCFINKKQMLFASCVRTLYMY
jgi:hypothetical protein